MAVDIIEHLRPSQPPPEAPVDFDDIRRRVRRRRRTRALTVAAVFAIAAPLAVSRLPIPTADVAFSPPVATAGPPAASSPMVRRTSIASVLALADLTFSPTPPGRAAVSKAHAVRAASDAAGTRGEAVGVTARHGVVRDGDAQGAQPQAVWAVRLPQRVVPQRGLPADEPVRGVTVVLVDAARGNVTMSMSTSTTPDGHRQESATVRLGAGATAGGRVPAAGHAPLATASTPRRAAMRAAEALGRANGRVRTLVYVAPKATRVLIEDKTGCWVYAATDAERDGTWEASGGEMPCDS